MLLTREILTLLLKCSNVQHVVAVGSQQASIIFLIQYTADKTSYSNKRDQFLTVKRTWPSDKISSPTPAWRTPWRTYWSRTRQTEIFISPFDILFLILEKREKNSRQSVQCRWTLQPLELVSSRLFAPASREFMFIRKWLCLSFKKMWPQKWIPRPQIRFHLDQSGVRYRFERLSSDFLLLNQLTSAPMKNITLVVLLLYSEEWAQMSRIRFL